MRYFFLTAAVAILLGAQTGWSADETAEKTSPADDAISVKGCRLGEESVQHWKVGVIVTAKGGPCRGIVATVPVPIDWPEQEVRVVDEQSSPFAKVGDRLVAGTVKQMLINIPMLPAGEVVEVTVTFEVARRALLQPADTSIFQLPPVKKLPKDIRPFLGPSPYIESRHRKIISLSKEIMTEKESEGAWAQVEGLFDWVREHMTPSRSPIPLKGAVKALADGNGDCEDLSSLFIALCRAGNIPARTVWVPGHCYPEFYLNDDEGVGHWFPCEPHGARAFGETPEQRPVLQKGDNFRVPERPRDRQRYVAEFLTGAGGKPSVKWIRESLSGGATAP